MSQKISTLIILLVIPFSLTWASDDIDGKKLTEENCTSCHGTEVYTRPDHRVQNMAQLSTQVRRCNTQLETQFFDEDMDAVAKHLNEAYYHFK